VQEGADGNSGVLGALYRLHGSDYLWKLLAHLHHAV
jgi:hypothetical protein